MSGGGGGGSGLPMPVMSLVFVSKKACQHIFVLSDPGVPRTFVGDCSKVKMGKGIIILYFCTNLVKENILVSKN